MTQVPMSISRRDFLLASGASITVLANGAAAGAANARDWRLPEKEPIETRENEWIPLKDGKRLAMRLWLPLSAQHEPVPVVLEYLPYRKRDIVRARDQAWGESFAPYGFGYARVDIRGSGESDGVLLGEYLPQEQQDGAEIIEWLARQPWCNGSVGMRGISWGGFNSLQIAALAPPSLKAIITHCATDNRYTDDAHYVGGTLTYDDLEWAAEFKNFLVAPPDPAIVGEEHWREMWMARLKATPPIAAEWLSHQRYDEFWKSGSVDVDYAAIKCPVFAIDGQIDCYRDFVPRLLTHLKVPCRGLIGSWGHRFPQNADPGPGLDWVPEEVRWWTHWLKGVPTGVMDEPALWAYMETQTASEVWPRDVPGRWVAEDRWPSQTIKARSLFLTSKGLSDAREIGLKRTIHSDETVGLMKREWFINEMGVDLPPDQTPDDQHSLVFDSSILDQDIEILGNPHVRVRLCSDQPVAHLAVRINEVLPDGKSWNVSYGVLNLTHRNGHERPEPMTVGHYYDIDVSCYFVTHRFKQGSRIRVALSESLWPMVWPSPQPVTLQLELGESRLLLPVRPRERRPRSPAAAVIRGATERKDTQDRKILGTRITMTGPDADGYLSIRKQVPEPARVVKDVGTRLSGMSVWTRSIRRGDPNSCLWSVEWTREMERGSWKIRTRSMVELSSTPREFRIRESIAAWQGDQQVFENQWDKSLARDLM